MSHASLAARYRPQTFAEVTGQETVKAILSRAAAEDKVAPAYLLSGTRGVGKTTIARIFAKALNCVHAPTGEPCNQCEQCRRITMGNHVDVVEIDAASNNGVDDITQSLNPYEMSFDIGYSRKLSEKFSMGVVFRYIYSDLGFSDSYAGDQSTGASAFSADISGYFTTYPMVGRSECQWSWGWNISNIGTKVAYNQGEDPAFLPTNLRLGTSFTFPLADYHNLSINLDANKLLVPARPRQVDYDMNTPEGQKDYADALAKWEDMSPFTGIFKSFSDAPGGMKEELREITWSLGAEYSYNNQFFLRAGYFYENEFKGNRQYFAMGAGFSLNVVRLDASYMLATAQSSPLDQTLRFTLSFDMDGLKDLFGRRR